MRYIHYAPTHVLYNGGDDFNGGHAGHGVVGSSKLRRAQKLTVLVRGFACESTGSAAPASREKGEWCSSAVAATCDMLSTTSLVARKLLGASFSLVRKCAGKPLLQWWRWFIVVGWRGGRQRCIHWTTGNNSRKWPVWWPSVWSRMEFVIRRFHWWRWWISWLLVKLCCWHCFLPYVLLVTGDTCFCDQFWPLFFLVQSYIRPISRPQQIRSQK